VTAVAPDLTVVVVTYQGAALLPGCLDALAAQTLPRERFTVVVVDNASSDGTPDLVRTRYPWVELVETGRNLGFAGGNNAALRDLRTPWALLLNNDARPHPDALERLLHAAEDGSRRRTAAFTATVLLADRFRPAGPEDDPDDVVHAVDGGVVVDPDGSVRLVNSTGNLVATDGSGRDRGWLEDAATHDPPPSVFGFCGAAVLLRRRALEDVGLLDDAFFMYYEDTDLSWRLRRGGWEVEHVADAVVDHIHAASSVEGSPLFLLHNDRNRLLTLTKNASARLVLAALGRTVLTLGSTTLRRREPWDRTVLRWRAAASYVRLLPHALRRRRHPEGAVRRSRREVEALLEAPTRPRDRRGR
jgi:N-acetylglucosaminyl-diphospho-decaprenol L-rhamnosyltransferase